MEIINGVDQDDICGDCIDIDGATIDDSVIGGITPSSGAFTTLDATGQLQGALINNQMVQKATFDILGLMTDPRLLNLQCEDPGAGTMTDVSGQGHDGTYHGDMTTGDRIKLGMGWAIDLDGIDDYIDFGDADDFSFGNGTNDEAVTWFGVVEIVNSSVNQLIISKRDYTTGAQLREWSIMLLPNRYLVLHQFDESTNVVCSRRTDSAISAGLHSFAVTSPGDGGITAMNNVKIYIDGIIVASTAINDNSYTAMESLSVHLWVGSYEQSDGTPASFLQGDTSLTGIDGSEMSAYDVHRFHQLCKGLYAI